MVPLKKNRTFAKLSSDTFHRSKSDGDLVDYNSGLLLENEVVRKKELAAAAAKLINGVGHENITTAGSDDKTASSISDNIDVVAQRDHHVIDHMPGVDDDQLSPAAPTRDIGSGSTIIMKYLVLTLLAPVGIIYQGKPDVLVSEYPVQFWSFIGAVCIYWTIMKLVVLIGHLIRKTNRKILNCIALACEVLAVISLVSVLFSHRVSLLVFFAFISSASLSAVVLLALSIFSFRT